MLSFRQFVALLFALTSSSVACGKGLPVIGQVYAVAEPDMLKQIEAKAREMALNGQYQTLMDAAAKRAEERLRRPAAVPSVKDATHNATRWFDPTYVYEESATDPQGRILVPAGTTVNPLSITSLHRPLLFFNGENKQQLAFARAALTKYNTAVQLVLTKGSPFEAMKELKVPVYFDQLGRLTRRLGVQNVPAVVTQDGMRLKIDEISLR